MNAPIPNATVAVLTHPWIATPTDGILDSDTLDAQLQVEHTISTLLTRQMTTFLPATLDRSSHLGYLTNMLSRPLPAPFVALDASRPWLLYWALHSLALLDAELDRAALQRIVDTLKACQNDNGGFGGGPGQISHLAPSYAAICALAYCGQMGWDIIDRSVHLVRWLISERLSNLLSVFVSVLDREGMYRFLLSVKQPDGSFIMHRGGEVDVRGCYCALTLATLLNILTPSLAHSTSSFIVSCQTYEGGLASSSHAFASSSSAEEQFSSTSSHPPLGEAHGGYAFCAAASYAMLRPFTDPKSPTYVEPNGTQLNSKHELDLDDLIRWSTGMQAMPIEGGGFRGRSNKLVDGCYSWWNGGLFGVIDGLLDEAEEGGNQERRDLYDRHALQEYVLFCAQAPTGGLRDKPGKPSDAYHTCYNLSGLSSAQHRYRHSWKTMDELRGSFVSPFPETTKIVDLEQEEDGEKSLVAMIKDEGESDEEAQRRMRECWSRSLGWKVNGKSVIVGEKDNELKTTHPLFNVLDDTTRKIMTHFYAQS
ncbi:BQ2448_2979 [Microbotryum intermedium]|uniref:Protein farnesyltransferase subunit beta n=1 Tax=Microbotryum intermedium TaxID=269621 RepID=A0A238FGY5_9BASI|nr:BQ2448_2979 [Microbotryum intermedium]